MGEATVATIAGLILGPHCLNWFNPISWGNTDYITLEICRIVLCIQIVAVAVELPRKYMKKHWISVAIFLLPVMTCGWLVVGLFVWALIPHFDFSSALLVSACVTATDPVLAAAVVGKGKFAQRVPGHLRNLLSAESGCNDGMAFPFIFLSLNLVVHPGNARLIVKDWFTLTILWECFFGCLLGSVLGLLLRHLMAFAERKNLIDRESFLATFVFLAFNSAGVGSMLGVDDLLVSFAAGTAFGWNGEFARKTEESHVSTVIDLLLNLAFFVYFGAIVPWPQFNNKEIGLNCWRLIILAIVIIFLRRIPAVLALKPLTPDVKTWREALFCGHFGPIGVGAIFAAILARKDLEAHYSLEETPLRHLPPDDLPHYQLIACIWPMVCFIVITSIIVHGSSVAVLTLGKRLNRMAITMSFTTTTQDQGISWMNRLQKLDKNATSFSLHRVHTRAVPNSEEEGSPSNGNPPVTTSGIKVKPAGGARRKKHKKRRIHAGHRIKKSLSRATTYDADKASSSTERYRPHTEFLQLDRTPSTHVSKQQSLDKEAPSSDVTSSLSSIQIEEKENKPASALPELHPKKIEEIKQKVNKKLKEKHEEVPAEHYDESNEKNLEKGDEGDEGAEENLEGKSEDNAEERLSVEEGSKEEEGPTEERKRKIGMDLELQGETLPATAYQEGNSLIIEDKTGEIIGQYPVKDPNEVARTRSQTRDDVSIHSMSSLRRRLSHYSIASENKSLSSENSTSSAGKKLSALKRTLSDLAGKTKRKAFKKKSDSSKKMFAHQVDNLIVIENEDGEVIRRYKINRHSKPDSKRPRSGSIVDKALSYVPLVRNLTKSDTRNSVLVQDTPSGKATQNKIIVPHSTGQIKNDNLGKKLERKLTDILNRSDKKSFSAHSGMFSGNSNLASGAGNESTIIENPSEETSSNDESGGDYSEDIDDENSDMDDENEDNVDQDGQGRNNEHDEDDLMHETAIEKRRRLAALGHMPTERLQDDEEE